VRSCWYVHGCGSTVDDHPSEASVIDEARALRLYKAALALVEVQGALVSIGKTKLREYRGDGLVIHYMPSTGYLDVWQRRKVLMVERLNRELRVSRYTPGDWESALLDAPPRGALD
jgi:hypothetical protein